MEALSNGGFSGNTLDRPRDEEVDREVKDEGEVIDEGEVENKQEEEKCMPLNEKAELRIEKYEVKIRYGKREIMLREDDLVLE